MKRRAWGVDLVMIRWGAWTMGRVDGDLGGAAAARRNPLTG
jgi:hypothetical protein